MINQNILDLYKRKEFYYLKNDPKYDFKQYTKELKIDDEDLLIYNCQIFVKNFMNPNTKYKRLFLKWGTGSGKTLGAIYIANEFIKSYKQLYEIYINTNKSLIPNIFILGFTIDNIKKELLKFPDLGFITRDEKNQLDIYQSCIDEGSTIYIKEYKDLRIKITKRLTTKKHGGFYKFYGYGEFFNKLFGTIPSIDKDELIKITDFKSEKAIIQAIDDGQIIINNTLMGELVNSLMICDEIHNTYNALEKNNYGIAIQYVIDRVKSLRTVYLSATPINTNPAEVVDIINLLSVNPDDKITKNDIINQNGKLIPNYELILKKAFINKFSFINEADITLYPTQEIVGYKYPEIDYLKFIKCPMSSIQYKTYQHFIENDNSVDIIRPHDRESLYNIVYPNPTNSIGLFKKKDLMISIFNANIQWKNDHNIITVKHGNSCIIDGSILKYSSLLNYSPKYATLIELLDKSIGKSLIYHNSVKGSGILLIRNILIQNGFIDDIGPVTNDTKCCICSLTQSNEVHSITNNTNNKHKFIPTRFLMIIGEVTKENISNIKNKYNKTSNKDGNEYKFLIASKIIREGHDLKCVRNVFTLTLPVNIPMFIQLIGRANRKKSHIDLPIDKWNIKIYILVSTIDNQMSKELEIYKRKIDDYKIIQQIETIMHKYAVDAPINRELNYVVNDNQSLGILNYDKTFPDMELSYNELDIWSFNVNNHIVDELSIILILIKKLFINQSVWLYNNLVKAIMKPPYRMEINPTLFNIRNIDYVLFYMLDSIEGFDDKVKYRHLLNKESNIIVKDYNLYRLFNIKEYIYLIPIQPYPLITYESFIRTNNKNNINIVNINSYFDLQEINKFNVQINNYIKENKEFDNIINLFTTTKNDQFYYELIKRFIEFDSIKLSIKVLEVFVRLNLIIRNNKKSLNKLTNDYILSKSQIDEIINKNNEYIGYIDNNNINIYDSKYKLWKKYNKIVNIRYNNHDIVGYYDNMLTFKIKLTLDKVKSKEYSTDARLVYSGISCTSKSKKDLKSYCQMLSIDDSGKINVLCARICNELLTREYNNTNFKYKWFYMFNEFEICKNKLN